MKSTGNCKECLLIGADISGKDLTHKNLARANLAGANLTEANLFKAYLGWADLNAANLTRAKLTRTNMKKIKNMDFAIKCKTIFPWGEDNYGCKYWFLTTLFQIKKSH